MNHDRYPQPALLRWGLILMCLLIGGHAVAWAEEPPQSMLQQQIEAAMERVYPALLYIQPVADDYRGGRRKQVVSSGSGVIISADGLALTNYHVAGKARYLLCTLSNKEQVEAELVGGDPLTDVAVLRLDREAFRKAIGDTFHPAELGTSHDLRVGQHVLAMGSPFGYDRSVSLGIVSCADRYLPGGAALPTGEPTGTENLWVQTDAAINPGNSGGPLVDLQGRVVGLNARVVFYGNSIGFAIPVDVVTYIKDQILAHGRVKRSWLGLTLQNTMDLEPIAGGPVPGVLISGVVADSPAAVAGLEAGDILLTAGNTALQARHASQLPAVERALARLPIGDNITLEVRKLSNPATRDVAVIPKEKSESLGDDADIPNWGLTVKTLTAETVRQLGVPVRSGVMVFGVQSGGPAAIAGLEFGDILVRIERTPIRSADDLRAALDPLHANRTGAVGLSVYRGRAFRYVLLHPSYGTGGGE